MMGSEPLYHALIYANDLKLSHYVKIAPRDMFIVQMAGGVLGSLVAAANWSWLMALPKVCTPEAPFRLLCAAGQSDFSNFMVYGTMFKKLFGHGGKFTVLFLGFPLGVLVPVGEST